MTWNIVKIINTLEIISKEFFMSKLTTMLLETSIDDNFSITGHAVNEVQRAYEILEELEKRLQKTRSRMPDKNTTKDAVTKELIYEIKKMMNSLDISKIIKISGKTK